ncbi:MAG: sulfotransferase family protein [Gammaproteobacteria bacterium]|nr:MAG: sulfotransferase family protein [Gammaproteobacteria bacterium]
MTEDERFQELRKIQEILQSGQKEQAYNRLQRFLRSPITDPYHYYCAATITYRIGFHQQTIDLLELSLRGNKNHAESHHLMAHCYLHLDRFAEAEQSILKAVQLDPDAKPLQLTLGEIYTFSGRYSEAERHYLKLLDDNDDIDILNALAFLYERSIENEKALDITEKILDRQPDNLPALRTRCHIYSRTGEYQKAEEILKNIVHKDPDYADAWFDLGKLQQKMKKYPHAFTSFTKANQLADRREVDPNQAEEEFNRYLRILGQIKERRKNLESYPSSPPVYIVGLPRSGTTLLSNMLDRHTSLESAGETPIIRDLYTTAKKMLSALHLVDINSGASISYGAWMDLNDFQINELAEQFQKDIRNHGNSVDQGVAIVDKAPSNILRLPLIALVSPKSPIIHMIRDGREASWSNFTQNFTHYHWFSHSLENCMRTWQRNILLARKCAEVFNLNYLEIRYEDLVTSPRETLGKILDFMGLPWEERCLTDYQNSSKPVLTASYEQVNKPLYTSSLHQARNYPEAYAGMTEIARDLLGELGYL